MDIYHFLIQYACIIGVGAFITGYRLYLDQNQGIEGGEPVLSITRAWFLLRFFDAGMLQLIPCQTCGGHFVSHVDDLHSHYVCGICHPPARAGKTRAAKLVAAIA